MLLHMFNWLKRLFNSKRSYKDALKRDSAEFGYPFHYTGKIETFTYSPAPKYQRRKQ